MKKIYLIVSICMLAAGSICILAFSSKRKNPDVVIPKPAVVQTSVSPELTRTQSAITQLSESLKLNPNDDKTKLMLSLAYIQAARLTGEHPYYYPLALKLTDEIIQHVSMNDASLLYEALVSKSSVQLSLHDFSGALATGKRALALRSDNASVYGILCDAHVELGQYDEAVKMTDKMISIRPDIRSYSRVSYLREIHGDPSGSIEAMKMAVAAGMPGLEQTAWARNILGQLYERNGDLPNAEMQYKITLQENPGYAFATAGLARIEAKKKNYDVAMNLFSEAASKLPEFSFHEEMAELNLARGKKDLAEKTAREVLTMLAEDTAAGHNSDLEYFNIFAYLLKDYKSAYTFANKEYSRRPDNIDACKAMAYATLKRNDLKNAAAYLKKANRTKKSDPELYCLSGMVAYENGQKAEGVSLIKKGTDMDPYSYNTLMTEAREYLDK